MNLRRRDVYADFINEYFNNKTITSVIGLSTDSEKIIFEFDTGESFEMHHYQECGEDVYVEDVSGNTDLNGAIFYEIVEKTSSDVPPSTPDPDSYTWTFYTIKTSKGYTDIRWYGESNGYYSEEVDLRCYIIEVKG